ncbi:phage tail protein [Photorhabdus sp. RM71S]|uniref:phage tail protein n=1 Tax=Photorhabdus sp. RM71S TaxID=3342824 RepID=UPI0036DB3C31
MAKNEFLTFGIAEGANVLSNEEYAALAARVNGFSAGVAKSRELNKAWRQSSIITHILADFIAKESGNDVLDNGNIDALKNSMALAIKNALPEMRDASLIEKGITQLTDKTGNSNTLAATQKLVSDVNDNANTKLAKSQNGADIPDKNAFVKNLGLVETVELAQGAVPGSRKVNGKALTGDISLNAGDVGAFPAAISVNSIPGRGFIGPFSGERGAYWAKGINIGQSSDVGQIYITANGLLYAYFLNSNGTVAGGAMGGCPVGVPLPYPHRYTPVGYLTCNGQSFDKSLYPKLAEAYPAGRVPDLRGEFIRGWDDSRGVDPGRVCGSWQPQQVQWHQHLGGHGGRGQGQFGVTNRAGYPGSYNDDGKQTLPFTNNGSDYQGFTNNGAVGAETRPRNVAFNYIVRAA